MEMEELSKEFTKALIENDELFLLIILGAMFFGFDKLSEKIGKEVEQNEP